MYFAYSRYIYKMIFWTLKERAAFPNTLDPLLNLMSIKFDGLIQICKSNAALSFLRFFRHQLGSVHNLFPTSTALSSYTSGGLIRPMDRSLSPVQQRVRARNSPVTISASARRSPRGAAARYTGGCYIRQEQHGHSHDRRPCSYGRSCFPPIPRRGGAVVAIEE